MAQLFSCWEQNIPWTRAKVWDPWKKRNALEYLISVSQEKQANKQNQKEATQKTHTYTHKKPQTNTMKNKWTKQSKTNTKKKKHKHNRTANLQNHRRKTHMSKSVVVFLHIKTFSFQNKNKKPHTYFSDFHESQAEIGIEINAFC